MTRDPRKRYVARGGKWVPVDQDTHRPKPRIDIMTDSSDPVRSPVDGTVIQSRRDMREHNARNQVECVGNDEAFKTPAHPEIKWSDRSADLRRALRQQR